MILHTIVTWTLILTCTHVKLIKICPQVALRDVCNILPESPNYNVIWKLSLNQQVLISFQLICRLH